MLLDDIAQYLTGMAVGVPVQKGYFQEIPNSAIALRETGGFASQHVNGVGPGQAILDEPTLQIATRAADYVTAMTLARQVYALLDGLRDLELNGLLYHFVRAMQPPFFLMRDDNHRFLCAFNIHVSRRTVT